MEVLIYITEEIVIKLLPFLTPEQADEIIEERKAKDYDDFKEPEENTEEVRELTEEEIDAIEAEVE